MWKSVNKRQSREAMFPASARHRIHSHLRRHVGAMIKQTTYRKGILKYRPRFPAALCANVHTYCNESCLMCPYPELSKRNTHAKMDWERYLRLLEDFTRGGGRLLTFNNFSEIFAIPEGLAYVTEALKWGKLDVYLVSNGLFLTREVSERLFAEGFSGMTYISCHGFSEDTFQRVTSRRSFAMVKENIEFFIRHHSRPGAVIIQCMRDLVPREECEMAERYWRSLGAAFNGITSHTFCEASTHKHYRNIKTDDLIGCRSWDLDGGLPFYQMVVQTDGDVSLCCMDVAREISLGNAFQSGIGQIWNGEPFRAIIERIYSGKTPACADFVCNRCPSALYGQATTSLQAGRLLKMNTYNVLSRWF